MVTDSASPVTHRTPTPEAIRFHDYRSAKRCKFCERPIHWMFTRYGTRLPFDIDLLPTSMDIDHSGWVPGPWQFGDGRRRMVMAPVSHYGRDKRRRVTHVALVHTCPEYMRNRERGVSA